MRADAGEIQTAKELNVNSVFTGFQNIAAVPEIRSQLDPSIKINIELQAFSKDSYLKHITDADVVCLDPTQDISNALCPSSDIVRNELLSNTQKCIEANVDGIWLDSLRFASKWAVAEPIITDTCYCTRCIKKFEEYLGDKLEYKDLDELFLLIDGSYYIEWLEFKTGLITSMAKQVKEKILASGKDIKLGYFAIPWEDKDYGAAIKRILGQNFDALANVVDITSPMLYHKMCGRDTEWIKQKVEYFWNLGKPFLPLVQTEDKPETISAQEFKASLENASKAPSMGVCIFFASDLAKDPAKLQVAKNFS
jgi:hypothetical protein